MASFEGVLSYEQEFDEESAWEPISKELTLALTEFESSRQREGLATETNIFYELKRFEAGLAMVNQNIAEIESTIKHQLKARFEELLPKGYDEQRLLQEIAVQLVRFGVNEEVSRLNAHISASSEQ